ncbi:NfeD family protein [Echinicola jeungdonensis]|uniref:NfeD family protein n=1 Tax=Echinicola jeungdonensis TaxID=709343 RepID=A0ABV5J0W9_9BACT|nr:NfeD family protein [Echinicola jeungdonensis]MDN3668296.1 NfeD family protein [Echinicola jeungdonensis]
MTWAIILSLLVLGLLLVLVEVIFVPGTTLVGILGVLFTGMGIYVCFQNFETETAFIVVALTVLGNVLVVLYGFRSGVWNRFSLKETSVGRAFDERLAGLEVGQKGRTISDVKPFGKAEFDDKIYEVKSNSGFISAGTEVVIHKLESNKIIIKQ